MRSGDTILEVDELIDDIGYAILSTDKEMPILRLHLTQEGFDSLGDVPPTLVGAKVKVFAFAEERGTLHASFLKTNGDLVTWRMEDPERLSFAKAFRSGNIKGAADD